MKIYILLFLKFDVWLNLKRGDNLELALKGTDITYYEQTFTFF